MAVFSFDSKAADVPLPMLPAYPEYFPPAAHSLETVKANAGSSTHPDHHPFRIKSNTYHQTNTRRIIKAQKKRWGFVRCQRAFLWAVIFFDTIKVFKFLPSFMNERMMSN
jgi:hypothetical protein